MAKVQTYLNFNGNTEEAFNFYRSIFGGEFSAVMRFKEMAASGMEGCEGGPLSAEDGEKIMHIALPVDDSVIMATDALESVGQSLTFGNNSYIYIETETKAEADRLFEALSGGGSVEMQIADTFWGDYFGSLKDKFAVQWMISAGSNS
jgi:PhnB protein